MNREHNSQVYHDESQRDNRYGAGEDYQPIFYGPNAQIRKEMPEEFMEEVDRYDRENNFPVNYDEMER